MVVLGGLFELFRCASIVLERLRLGWCARHHTDVIWTESGCLQRQDGIARFGVVSERSGDRRHALWNFVRVRPCHVATIATR